MPAIRPFAVVALLVLATLPLSAKAGTLEAFQADLLPAYEQVRSAIFYLRRGARAPAMAEVSSARAAWRDHVLPYADTPPGAFASDPEFAATLREVEGDLTASLDAGTADTALEALSGIPDKLAELRARNHVVVFADRVAEANRAMDRLWAYRHREIDFDDLAMVDDLRARLAVTQYTYENCLQAAPEQVAADPAFQRIIKGTLSSLDQMWQAIATGERLTIINILREVRSFDKLLWLSHG